MADKRVGRLLPFLTTAFGSLVWFAPQEEPGVLGLMVKCLPIACLMGFLIASERGQRDYPWVVAALLASLVGDACLVWPDDYFVGGIASFGVAQGLYVAAFGFQGVSWVLGAALHVFNVVSTTFVMLPCLPVPHLRVVVPLYSIVITCMLWRALDRARFRKDLPGVQRLCTAVGAATFCLSDVSIVLLQLASPPAHHLQAQLVILSTYYMAQLLLVLGSAQTFWAEAGSSQKKLV